MFPFIGIVLIFIRIKLVSLNNYVSLCIHIKVVSLKSYVSLYIYIGKELTCDFSTVAVCLSHIGEMSSPCWRSRSPWRKNSSMTRWTHAWYNSNGFVGLLRSEQWTIFCNTWKGKPGLFVSHTLPLKIVWLLTRHANAIFANDAYLLNQIYFINNCCGKDLFTLHVSIFLHIYVVTLLLYATEHCINHKFINQSFYKAVSSM